MSHVLNFKNWTRLYESAGAISALNTLQKLADKYGETLYTSSDGLTKSTAIFKVTEGAAGIDDPKVIANFTEPTPGKLYVKIEMKGKRDKAFKKVKEGNVTLTENGITNIAGVALDSSDFTDGKGAVQVTKVAHDSADKYRNLSPIAAVIGEAMQEMTDVRMQFEELGGADDGSADETWISTSRGVMTHEVNFGNSNKKYVDETQDNPTPTQRP